MQPAAHACSSSNKLRIVLDGVGDLVARRRSMLRCVLLDIGLGDIDRAAQRVLHPAREQRVHAQIEGHRGEDRDQDGGHHGDGGEPGDQPHMQPGAGAARSALAHSRTSRQAISAASVSPSVRLTSSRTIRPARSGV